MGNRSHRNRRVLGVVPARGGSKGIPSKNIVDLLGRPLIDYTIGPALASRSVTDLVVSTDDPKIAEIATNSGAPPPFLRPHNLSTDDSHSLPVILHSLEFMEDQKGVEYDAVIMLQPTTPLRSQEDIDESVDKLFRTEADSVISVSNLEGHHPLRMKRIIGDLLVNYMDQGMEDMRPRQELPPVFIRNGAIYATTTLSLRKNLSFAGPVTRPYLMPLERSVNIDTELDLIVAKHLLAKGGLGRNGGQRTK